jgi:hypothetical protein
MKKTRIEIIDGVEYEVTVLPDDYRLQPGQVKKRQLFQSMSSQEKKRFFREKREAARERRKAIKRFKRRKATDA